MIPLPPRAFSLSLARSPYKMFCNCHHHAHHQYWWLSCVCGGEKNLFLEWIKHSFIYFDFLFLSFFFLLFFSFKHTNEKKAFECSSRFQEGKQKNKADRIKKVHTCKWTKNTFDELRPVYVISFFLFSHCINWNIFLQEKNEEWEKIHSLYWEEEKTM